MNSTLTFICMLWSILMCAHVPLHTYLDTYLHTLRQSHLHIFYFMFIITYILSSFTLHFLFVMAMQKSLYNEISLTWRFPKYLIPYGGFILWLLHFRHLNKKSACVKTEKNPTSGQWSSSAKKLPQENLPVD